MSLEETVLILDWSGVISDDRETVLWAFNQTLIRTGSQPISMNDLCNNYGNAGDVQENYGVMIPASEFWCTYKEFLPKAPKQPTIISGVNIVLSMLKGRGVKLTVFSAHPQVELEKDVMRYNIKDLFHVIEGDVVNKTDRIKAFMKEIDASRENTFYAGDTTVDIIAGRAAGVVTIGVTTGYHSRTVLEAARPDYIVESLKGVIPIILQLIAHSPRL